MLGQMQDHPLLISTLIDFAARHHHEAQIVSRRVEGDLHRYTYADAHRRAKRAATTQPIPTAVSTAARSIASSTSSSRRSRALR